MIWVVVSMGEGLEMMMGKTISDIGEFEFIERLRRGISDSPDIILGIGDDAAAVKFSEKGNLLLLATDTIIEGVYFHRSAAPFDVGWKAMAVNISDIAAMGGVPRYALVAVSVPTMTEIDYLDELYRGMQAVAKKFGAVITGGDTTRSESGLVITVTVTGEVEPGLIARRSAAKAGQALVVTGALGGSGSGKHLRFSARGEEARFLVEKVGPVAMIDISDGLASDLGRIVEQSGVGARIFAGKIPVSTAAEELGRGNPDAALSHALYDGEDFELLLALNPKIAVNACAEFQNRFNLPLTIVGEITGESGKVILVNPDTTEQELKPGGYDHFRKQS